MLSKYRFRFQIQLKFEGINLDYRFVILFACEGFFKKRSPEWKWKILSEFLLDYVWCFCPQRSAWMREWAFLVTWMRENRIKNLREHVTREFSLFTQFCANLSDFWIFPRFLPKISPISQIIGFAWISRKTCVNCENFLCECMNFGSARSAGGGGRFGPTNFPPKVNSFFIFLNDRSTTLVKIRVYSCHFVL